MSDSNQSPIFFHKDTEFPYGIFCQWYFSDFLDEEGRHYKHAEQYMMYHKALKFEDTASAREIMRTSSPQQCKAIGSRIKGFKPDVWDTVKQEVVTRGNMLKFTRACRKVGEDWMLLSDIGSENELLEILLATGDRELHEASRFDRVWGTGFDAETCRNGLKLKSGGARRESWGESLLGKCIMKARRQIQAQLNDFAED